MLLVILLAIVMPVSLILWLTSLIYSLFVGDPDSYIAAWRWLVSIVASLLLAWYGLRKKSLDKSGAVAGVAVGFLLTISNMCFFASLMTFFLLASKATKYRSSMKQKFEADFKEGGQRNWVQVICNGGIASQFAMLYMLDNGVGEMPVDFSKQYMSSYFSTAVLGALACCCGDTFASELGTVFRYNTEPRLITTFRKVPKGTNGGISLVGTIFSLIGGLVVGMAYYVTLIFSLSDAYLQKCPPQWPIIILGALSGFLGSGIDSYLGATLQYSGHNRLTNKIVESPGKDVDDICGWPLLDNHSVNLLSSLFCGLLTPKVAFYLWWLFV